MAPNKRKHDAAGVVEKLSKRSVPSRCLNPFSTSLAFARITSPCRLKFQAKTYFAGMMFSPSGCYTPPNVPVPASPLYSSSIARFQMTEVLSAHAAA